MPLTRHTKLNNSSLDGNMNSFDLKSREHYVDFIHVYNIDV